MIAKPEGRPTGRGGESNSPPVFYCNHLGGRWQVGRRAVCGKSRQGTHAVVGKRVRAAGGRPFFSPLAEATCGRGPAGGGGDAARAAGRLDSWGLPAPSGGVPGPKRGGGGDVWAGRVYAEIS